MKIICISDIHGNKKQLSHVINKVADFNLALVAGDITHAGGYKEAKEIIQPLLDKDHLIFAVHGNMDKKDVLTYLEETGPNLHGHFWILGQYAFFGLGGSNPTPFRTYSEYTDAEAEFILKKPLAAISKVKKKIFVSHAPPFDTILDQKTKDVHIGSAFVRKIILQYNVDLCVCGHVHEAAGIDKVGDCICVNPGPLRDGNYAIAEFIDDDIQITRCVL